MKSRLVIMVEVYPAMRSRMVLSAINDATADRPPQRAAGETRIRSSGGADSPGRRKCEKAPSLGHPRQPLQISGPCQKHRRLNEPGPVPPRTRIHEIGTVWRAPGAPVDSSGPGRIRHPARPERDGPAHAGDARRSAVSTCHDLVAQTKAHRTSERSSRCWAWRFRQSRCAAARTFTETGISSWAGCVASQPPARQHSGRGGLRLGLMFAG